MTRDIIQPNYGYFFSIDSKTKEIMRIYYKEGVDYPKLVDKKGNYVPATKVSLTKYENLKNDASPTFMKDESNHLIVVEFSQKDNRGWFQKIDEDFLDNETLELVQEYNSIIAAVSKFITIWSPEPYSKAIAGIIFAVALTVAFAIQIKFSLNKIANLKDRRNGKALFVLNEMEKNLKLLNKLDKDLKKIGDMPIDFKKGEPNTIEYSEHFY